MIELFSHNCWYSFFVWICLILHTSMAISRPSFNIGTSTIYILMWASSLPCDVFRFSNRYANHSYDLSQLLWFGIVLFVFIPNFFLESSTFYVIQTRFKNGAKSCTCCVIQPDSKLAPTVPRVVQSNQIQKWRQKQPARRETTWRVRRRKRKKRTKLAAGLKDWPKVGPSCSFLWTRSK